ncbi:MAG: salicylate synthase, partial [Frankia sp.]|nr:salicylate synthase [Frankia sp.]
MTTHPSYHAQSVAISADPLVLAASLARRARGPLVVYERAGEWACASGTLAEITVSPTEVRTRVGPDEPWRTEPTSAAPLRQVAAFLDGLGIAGWRAYGWAGFELVHLLHGLPSPSGDQPVLHLVIPAREVRLSPGVAVVRTADLAELPGLVTAVSGRAALAQAGELDALAAASTVDADLDHGAEPYRRAVAAAVADIARGRLRKVIVSRAVPVPREIDLAATYVAGRRGNNPARSFLVDVAGRRAVGFSPETVVEVSPEGIVSIQPLAGTRALTGEPLRDRELRQTLLDDPKEVYEHAVSVQTCQDELRTVCRPGSVAVDEFMHVLERGSVQHLASRVSGRLAVGRDCWDALGAAFPSITASGIPKPAACASLDRYESEPRGIYSGAVLVADENGALDAALVLRTVFQENGRTWLRAGAGIVAGSQPERELEETREKLRSVSRFLVPAAPATVPATLAPAAAARAAEPADAARPGAVSLAEVRRSVAEILHTDPASVDDEANLFELGLESIAVMKTVGRWRRCGIEVSFADLAENPTIDGWYKLLSSRAPAAPGDEPPAAPGDEPAAARGAPPAGTAAASAASPPPAADAQPAAGGEGARAGEDDSFPLALMQHAYWVGRTPGQPLSGVAAHLYTEFDGADVDPDRLRAAIERLTAHHDMLRVRVTDNGRQVIEASAGWHGLAVHDLRGLPRAEVEARLARVRDRMSHQMLDLEAGEVFAVALSLLPGGRTRLHLDVDMVAGDAVSYRLLLADLARCYADPGTPLPAVGYSYREYREARAQARRDAAERARQWWQGRLASLPGPPDLPRAATVPGHAGSSTPRVARRHITLPPAARAALGQAARARGITPAAAMATAFAEVIGGWSAAPRFLLNVPLFDREQLHPDVDRLVGDFTSSVLLEVDLTDSVDFATRARRLQARLHADAAHADYSGVEVLRDLSRRAGQQVIAPVVFTSALNLGELFAPQVRARFGDPVWIISQGPQVLLDAQVTELDGGLLVNWDCREDEFPPGMVDAMFEVFARLVGELAEGGDAWDRPVGSLVTDAVQAVRAAANDTAGPRSTRLLHQGFFERATGAPERAALVWDAPGAARGSRAQLTYGELAARALRVAGGLARRGVRPGDLVGVSLPKGADQVVTVLGILAAGATYVPVSVDQPAARVARIADVAGLAGLITIPARAELPGGLTRWHLDGLLADEPLAAPVARADALDAPAYVLFTSGSTGQPKGVQVSHRAAMNTLDDLIERLGLGEDDRTLAVSALDFDLSVFDLFAPLSVGGAAVLLDEDSRREARRWAELVHDHAVTVLNCVPTVLDLVLREEAPLGDSLRAVLLGGDRVGVDLPGRLAAAVPGCRFIALGGTTETAIHSTVCEVSADAPVSPEWLCVPYGRPLRNVRLRVVDALGRDCPDHVAGELWIGGDGVALGYLADPERTADRFVEFAGQRWYRTGDLARYLPDGTVEFLGRRDNQVKIRGFRVELGEVEAALAAVPGVLAGVAAVTTAGGGGGPSLGAAVVLDAAAADGGTDAVREALRQLLPPHMVPDRIVALDEIPLTANGKIDRRAVGALLADVDAVSAAVPPRDDLERVLVRVWREVLRVDQVGVTDEFFALGGDSVLATALVARLRTELDTDEITVRTVFGAPTVAALAAALRQAESTPGRLDQIAALVLEIDALSDEEVEAQLAGQSGDPADVATDGAAAPAAGGSAVGSALAGDWVPVPAQLAQRYRDAGYWRDETLGELLRQWAAAYGAATAVVDGSRRLSYAELDAEADNLAAGLRDLGIGAGDRVVVHLSNRVEFVTTLFALLRLGAPGVLALPAHRRGEIEHFARLSDAVAYVIPDLHEGHDYRPLADELLAEVDSLRHVIVVGDPGPFTALSDLVARGAAARAAGREVPRDVAAASDVALMLISGGTTGRPKLIPRTHRDYAYNARASAEVCGLTAVDVYLAALPAAHNFPLACPGILGTLGVGGTVVMAPVPSPDVAFGLIERHRVTVTALVPSLARLWVEATAWERADLSSLRLLQVGGARLEEELARRIPPALGCGLQQVFGMAEGLLNYTRLDDPDELVVTTQGRPLSPADEVRIVDADGAEVADGEVGELLTRGPYTIRGYYRAAAHNATAFTPDGYYRSGDLVRRLPSGHLVVEGRVKDVINRAGESIAVGEIEDQLAGHPAVRPAPAGGRPAAARGGRGWAGGGP